MNKNKNTESNDKIVKVIDNFLSEEDHFKLLELFYHPSFPWFYSDKIISSEDNHFHFVHVLFDSNNLSVSRMFDEYAVKALMKRIDAKALIKVKANCTTRTENIIKTDFHIDYPENFGSTTGIYYINSNNGYTFFEDGSKVESVANRFICFPVGLKHAGTNCTDEKTRRLININYF